MAKRISIINFKGGVGKTTLTFNLGTGLACFHSARVLLVDMDHQSSLSIVCLGPDKWEKAVNSKQTVDEIFRPFVVQSIPPGDEIVIKAPVENIFGQNSYYHNCSSMDIVPANLSLDDTEIELTASHHAYCTFPDFRGISFESVHYSILSRKGASDKPGAIQL